MKLKKESKSKGGNWVLQYTKEELQHKSFYLDNMIFKRQEKLSGLEVKRIKLQEKLILLKRGITEEIIKTEKEIRDLSQSIPKKLQREIEVLVQFKEEFEKEEKEKSKNEKTNQ
ncbi:hypothetical protein RyT2_07650 [Pseudolactococcus yaeyamensis]